MAMERSKIVEKAAKDVDDFIAQLKPKKYEDGWPEDRWEKEIEKHPIFMSKELEQGEDLPPLVEAFQQLKYDPSMNTPDELATAHKEDGNVHFKKGKYRWAVMAYSEGIAAKPEGQELKAQLFANRAAAQYYVGNYGKSLSDSTEAKNVKPDYLKAYTRGAMCCFQLDKFLDCISWCEEGLQVYLNLFTSSLEPENKCFIDLKKKSEEQKKICDRNKRRALAQETKKKREKEMVLKAIRERGISLEGNKLKHDETGPLHAAVISNVHLDGNQLVWPVVFMYPEYQTTDFIQEFNEDTCFMDHLEAMFNADNILHWDKNRQYLAKNLQIYFNDKDDIIPVGKKKTLKDALTHSRYRVYGGIPSFIITVKNSEFDRFYREKHGCSAR